MDENYTKILAPIKRIIITIGILIFFILIGIVLFQSHRNNREYTEKYIIDAIGKQRMYTQYISKEANSLHSLWKESELGDNILSDELIDRMEMKKLSLEKAKREFNHTLETLHNKRITVNNREYPLTITRESTLEYLTAIDQIWGEFNQAVEILLNSQGIDKEVDKAVTYINSMNMDLLQLCELVSEEILLESMENTKKAGNIFTLLVIVLGMLAFIALFHLLKYIILPFHQLYKGISQIGLQKYYEKMNYPTKKRVIPMVHEINNVFQKINHIISLIENMNNNSSFIETLNFINETFSEFVPYNYIGIALIDSDKKFLRASYGVSDGTIQLIPGMIMKESWYIKETSLDHLIKTGEARIINDLEAYTANKPLKLYNKIIMEAGIKASITLPLMVSGKPVGVIFFSSSKKNVYHEEHLNFLKTLANSIAISLNQNILINDIVLSSIVALAKLAEARDEDTGDHLDRMKIYSRVIAELLYSNNIYLDELNPEYIEKLERFSPLHDIGKVGINDSILLKPGKLTKEEFEEMKKHATFGAEVLRAAEQNMNKRGKSLFGLGIEIAEGHHEKWDGSGYPYGKRGDEIPLSARIVAMADVFDALTSRRPYKEPFSFDTAIKIIEEGSGKHFDPEIVKIFLTNRHIIEATYQELHNQELYSTIA